MSEENIYKHDLAPCALMSETSGYIQYINHLSKIIPSRQLFALAQLHIELKAKCVYILIAPLTTYLYMRCEMYITTHKQIS